MLHRKFNCEVCEKVTEHHIIIGSERDETWVEIGCIRCNTERVPTQEEASGILMALPGQLSLLASAVYALAAQYLEYQVDARVLRGITNEARAVSFAAANANKERREREFQWREETEAVPA